MLLCDIWCIPHYVSHYMSHYINVIAVLVSLCLSLCLCVCVCVRLCLYPSLSVCVSLCLYVSVCVYSLSLRVQLYLRIDRADLAQRELRAMKALDEDSTLSMLATAWVNLAMVGAMWVSYGCHGEMVSWCYCYISMLGCNNLIICI
jgi:hypothetical protein